MALTLVKETGAVVAGANSYANAADGDAYHEGHLYATAWTGATTGKKEAALVMATRLIDALFQFNGLRVSSGQALQWPRFDCPDPDRDDGLGVPGLVESTAVPPVVVQAAIETARALIVEDRTGNPVGEGLKFQSLGDLQQSFDKADRRPVLPRVALGMLAKLGRSMAGTSGTVRLVKT